MKNPNLSLELKGKNITSVKFKSAIDSFFNFVDGITYKFSEKEKPFKWIISVEKGSIRINLSPKLEQKEISFLPNIVEEINTGLNIINQERTRPEYYTDEILTHIKSLASTISAPGLEGISDIIIHTNGRKNKLAPDVIKNIDSILSEIREDYGSFEGKIELISSRGGFHFNLYNLHTNKHVKCIFRKEDTGKILNLFGKPVYVFGLIKYKKSGIPISIQLREIHPLSKREDIPSAKNVLGILKGIK